MTLINDYALLGATLQCKALEKGVKTANSKLVLIRYCAWTCYNLNYQNSTFNWSQTVLSIG